MTEAAVEGDDACHSLSMHGGCVGAACQEFAEVVPDVVIFNEVAGGVDVEVGLKGVAA
jgi:hypothetical protein